LQTADATLAAYDTGGSGTSLSLRDLAIDNEDTNYFLEYSYRWLPRWALVAGAYSFSGSGARESERDFEYDGAFVYAHLRAAYDVTDRLAIARLPVDGCGHCGDARARHDQLRLAPARTVIHLVLAGAAAAATDGVAASAKNLRTASELVREMLRCQAEGRSFKAYSAHEPSLSGDTTPPAIA
jgi:hypothetical protein